MQEKLKKEITPDEDFYNNEPVGSYEEHYRWMKEIEFYFNGYSDYLNKKLDGSNGFVAELGAGSCGLSACLTRLPNIKRVSALDISLKRMEQMIELSTSILGNNNTEIIPLKSDFNKKLPFEDKELDVILFDASLHHTRSMWNTLEECNRVLRKDGLLIAQRESYLSPFRSKKQIKNLLKTPEIAAKVSENMYLLSQYKYYFEVSGFKSTFLPRSPNFFKRFLKNFNGTFFCDGILLGNK